MIDLVLAAKVSEARHQDYLREAMHYRLCKEAGAVRPCFWDRLLASAGELLISIGQVLQRLSRVAGPEADLPSQQVGLENR